MADQGEHYERSWILHHILDRMIGSRDMVDIRRKLRIMDEYIINGYEKESHKIFLTGSLAEGFLMKGSDSDMMIIATDVNVMCPNEDTNLQSDNRDMTIFIMRNAHDSRPCYVTLELVKIGRSCKDPAVVKSLVPLHDLHCISSEMYAQHHQDLLSAMFRMELETHGPAASMKNGHSYMGVDLDYAFSFACASWPPVANEWLIRPRLHGWPEKALIYDISQSGCHVVPVGDKTSPDTFLQWRISFATAERKLIHSLSHEQFLVHGLLKYFMKQISGKVEEIIGDADILSSYIVKTVIFCAVENTPPSLWKEQNTFPCFMHCLRILILWIHAGYCPNYFILGNNMFHGKLHGGNQQKLLCLLMEWYDMNWMCLSVGTFIQPSIGMWIESVMNGEWKSILRSPLEIEYDYDQYIFIPAFGITEHISRPLALLYESKSGTDEFIAYRNTICSLCCKGMGTFGEHIPARGNKGKYKSLRKCNNFIKPLASVSTSPGQLTLATYYYHTGNYMKALALCGNMISSFKVYVDQDFKYKNKDRYQHMYCGRGYTLLHKYQEAVVSCITFPDNVAAFCPSQLQPELTQCVHEIRIQPLPYALFLSFLCYHDLGDIRRRDTALTNLRAVKYDEEQGGAKHWIVHNLIGICYEMVGDNRRAIREYRDSLSGEQIFQGNNPAMGRIARLQHSQ